MPHRSPSVRCTPLLAALLLGLVPGGHPERLVGQERAPAVAETPEQVTQQIIVAMRAQDWAGIAGLMHPAALAELRSLFDVLLESEAAEAPGIRSQLFGVETVEEAKALSDTVIFTNLMRALMAEQAGMNEALATAEFKVMGHVAEGVDTAHVVYRMSMTVEKISISIMDVASLTRYGSTWRGLLKGDLRALAAGMRKAMLKES